MYFKALAVCKSSISSKISFFTVNYSVIIIDHINSLGPGFIYLSYFLFSIKFILFIGRCHNIIYSYKCDIVLTMLVFSFSTILCPSTIVDGCIKKILSYNLSIRIYMLFCVNKKLLSTDMQKIG